MYYLLSLLLAITPSELCNEVRVELDVAVEQELLTLKEADAIYNRCAGRQEF